MNNQIKAIIDMLAVFLPDIKIVIAEGFDCIETPDGNKGFGVYDVNHKTIYVAGDLPNPSYQIPFTIFHELYHDYQIRKNLKIQEETRDVFATMVCEALGLFEE